MKQNDIRPLHQKIGATVDGFLRPKSIAACQDYLRGMMPSPHPFSKQSAVETGYGRHGEPTGDTPPLRKIRLPFNLCYGSDEVRSLNPHEPCADSLPRVFERLAAAFPDKGARHEAGLLTFDGLYHPGKMRDSSSAWSIHAWAIAIDLSPSRNGDKTRWPSNATMPIEGMEFLAQEGWTPAGALWSRDAAYSQVTAPKLTSARMHASAALALIASVVLPSCTSVAGFHRTTEVRAGFESHSFAAVPHVHSPTPTQYAKSDYLPVGDVLPSISRLRIERSGANDALGGVAYDFVSSGATVLAAIAAAGSGITPAVSSESEEGSGKGSNDIAEQIKRITVDPSVIPIR